MKRASLRERAAWSTLSAPRRRRPTPRRRRDAIENWPAYAAFWAFAALTFLGLGIATFLTVAHGRRIGLALLVLCVACLTMASLIRRAGRGSG